MFKMVMLKLSKMLSYTQQTKSLLEASNPPNITGHKGTFLYILFKFTTFEEEYVPFVKIIA